MEIECYRNVILSKPFFERIPAQYLLKGEQGEKYDYMAITRGGDYLFAYTWNGSDISIDLEKLDWQVFRASWYDPRNGKTIEIGLFEKDGTGTFDPPGGKTSGNDWVLILEKS